MFDLEDFRAETRAWLEENCPASMREPVRSDADICWGGRNFEFKTDDQRLWLERMAEKGWTAPTWPEQYGGGGLSPEQAKVLREEMARINAREPLKSFGISMVGPAIIKWGSEELKQEHLPKICRGEIRWCQGYSEPGAGSDLAGLQTKAEDKGDHYLINGQKIWTSYAHKADWIFCLVRTSWEGKKQEGITLILFDMETPGVEARPIRLISGASVFCETFFTDVKADKKQVVGEVNKGWTYAKYILTHEREMVSAIGGDASAVDALGVQSLDAVGADDQGRLDDPILRADIARWEIDQLGFRLTLERAKDEAKAGEGVGHYSALLKYAGTELNKRRLELKVAAEGMGGLAWEGQAWKGGALAKEWLRSKANSIEGGTSEVQLGIIAKNVLGMK